MTGGFNASFEQVGEPLHTHTHRQTQTDPTAPPPLAVLAAAIVVGRASRVVGDERGPPSNETKDIAWVSTSLNIFPGFREIFTEHN